VECPVEGATARVEVQTGATYVVVRG